MNPIKRGKLIEGGIHDDTDKSIDSSNRTIRCGELSSVANCDFRGRGVWVTDPEGNRYMDMLSAYSAVNQGHRHPRIIEALKTQADRVTLTSRAFHNDQLGPWYEKICKLTNKEMALPMNTGAEAVETAIKAARRWGYDVKGIEENRAEIIACTGNFHGRTMTAVSLSSEAEYQRGFGPMLPGIKAHPLWRY